MQRPPPPQQHIWLPSLRVWAPTRLPPPTHPECSVDPASHASPSSHHLAIGPAFSVASLPPPTSDDFVNKPEEDNHKKKKNKKRMSSRRDDSSSPRRLRRLYEDPNHNYKRSCPICLSFISESDLCVLRWCMHSYCVGCIERWSRLQRFCPLCKQTFHGWYYNIRSSSQFDVKDLIAKASQTCHQLEARRRAQRYPISRVGRHFPASSLQRSQPLPWRRQLFRSSLQSQDAEYRANKTLEWRASIYQKHLRAIPPPINRRVNVNLVPINNPDREAYIRKRLEPWVLRELQAITGDPDPSLLVQLVLSLWLNVLMHREKHISGNVGIHETQAIEQLMPFLNEKTAYFWHELKCFAECPLSMRAYDSVISYEDCQNV